MRRWFSPSDNHARPALTIFAESPVEPRSVSSGMYHIRPPEILALRGSQRAAISPPPTPTPDPSPTTPESRKAATVRIRLHGTPPEIAAMLAALREVLTITNESRPYPDRPPSALIRVYMDAEPRQFREESK
jgi:hypothetical protein